MIAADFIIPILNNFTANNSSLLNSDLYVGLPQKRGPDKEYFEFMDEFMDAVYDR